MVVSRTCVATHKNYNMASGTTLHFDPDQHPDDTLKAFNEFIQSFYLRYEAQYPDPPKVSIDAAIERWKLANDTAKPMLEQYDSLRNEWRSKDRVAKFLGMFSSRQMYADWQVAEPDETKRTQATWEYFDAQIQAYYKPTENLTLKNHQFRTLMQATHEAFPAFCNVCTKKHNTATPSAKMMIARQKKQQSKIRSLSRQPITRSEKRPSRTHGTYQIYTKKECK